LRITTTTNHPDWLVEQEHARFLNCNQRNAINLNQLRIGIGLIPKARNTPINRYATSLKPIFSTPT
jgi:hypothetical protein